MAAAAATVGLGKLARGILNVTLEITGQLRLTLAIFSRTQNEANKVFSDLQKLAARTPFALDQIIQSYNTLRALNLSPTIAQVEALGNIAAASGKQYGEFNDAVVSALAGSYETLRRYGIQIRKESDKLIVDAGRGVEEIQATPEALFELIASLGNEGIYQGAADKLSKTLGGAISTLKDNIKDLGDEFGKGEFRKALVELNVKLTESSQKYKELAGTLWRSRRRSDTGIDP